MNFKKPGGEIPRVFCSNGPAENPIRIHIRPAAGRLLPPGERQGQVHADGKFAVERAPVLPGHAHVPAGFQQFIQRFSIVTAPCAAVQEEHIRSLRPAYLNAGEMFLNVAAGEIDIFCKYLAQLIHPFFSFPAVRSDEAVHRADIHAVVVGSAADGANRSRRVGL